VSGAVVSTVHVCVAGVASTLPASPLARTEKVCDPSARPEYDLGAVHASYAPPSSLHSNDAPAGVEEKSNDAVLEATVPLGPLVIEVSGAGGGGSADGETTSRTVRTPVPLTDRAASQSRSADSVVGFTQPSSHAVSQTPWKTIGTQPPPASACVITFCIAARVISPLPNAGVRVTNGSAGGIDSDRGLVQSGHQLGETTPPTRRPEVYPQSRTAVCANESTAPYG
jgi:hypothetical protein